MTNHLEIPYESQAEIDRDHQLNRLVRATLERIEEKLARCPSPDEAEEPPPFRPNFRGPQQ